MKIAAVVVTYNRKSLLLENIEALLHQTVKDVMDIVIIDNASTDGTYDAIKCYEDSGNIIYCNTGANLGGAGGFNFGMRYAVEHGYDYIWVMDDDCIPNCNALEEFLEVDSQLDGNYGFLSSKVLWKDNNICTMNIQRKTMYRCVKDFETVMVPVVMASFVSLFVPTKIVCEFGLPIKDFFIWTDDWEFTRRISRKYPCYLVNTSVVIHKSGSNIGANIATETVERLGRFDYLYRNDVYLYRREGFQGYVYECVRLVSHILRVLFRANDSKILRIKKIINGTLNGFSFNPRIERIVDMGCDTNIGVKELDGFCMTERADREFTINRGGGSTM